jgi:hypothetical protein
MDVRQPLERIDLFSVTSLVPIETNVESEISPAPGTSDSPDQAPRPGAGAVGKHDFSGRFTMCLPSKEELELRHGCWHRRRQMIRTLLETGIAGRTRRDRWDSCGAQAMLSWHKSVEVTFNPTTQQWHPHLHPITSGSYMPQDVLSRKWKAITGNSPIVHIKAIPDAEIVAGYVSKYAAKCMDNSVFENQDKLSELLVALGGRRFCLTFGSWRGWKLLEHTPLDMSDFKPIGTLTSITHDAACGDALAIRTLNALRRNLRWEDLNPDALEDALPPA